MPLGAILVIKNKETSVQHYFINFNLRNLCTIEDGFVIRNILLKFVIQSDSLF